MKQLFTRRTLILCLVTFVISIALNGGVRTLNVWLSPTGAVLRTLIFALTFIQGGVLFYFLIQWIGQASLYKISQSTKTYMLI
ncbi:MAG: hypothetical protein AAF485_15685, partial [Chloroflexota bacterium]